MDRLNYDNIIRLANEEACKAVLFAMREKADNPRLVKGFYHVFSKDVKLRHFVERCYPSLIHKKTVLFVNPGKFVGQDQRIFDSGGEAFCDVFRRFEIPFEVERRQRSNEYRY